MRSFGNSRLRSTHPTNPRRNGRMTPMPEPLTITTPGDRQIVVTRAFDAPRELVFLCYSKPELLRRWYGMPDWTMPVCEIDFRVGGKWRFVQRSPDGFEMGSQGIYTGIEKPAQIDQTETYDDN